MTQCGIEPCAAMPKAGSHTVWISPILILIFCQMSHLQVRSCRGVHLVWRGGHRTGENTPSRPSHEGRGKRRPGGGPGRGKVLNYPTAPS